MLSYAAPLPKKTNYLEIEDLKKLGVPTEWKMQDDTESHNNDSGSENIPTLSFVELPKKMNYPTIKDPKKLQRIDANAHAKKLSASTESKIQNYTGYHKKKHQDVKLQTLLYPEDLDRLVRRISSEAKTAIKESGVNMLFLCLGFLKWSEAKDSSNFCYAPLIVVPIEIERDKTINARTGFSNFYVKYTGEDILDNICLREKLKQLSIELPSFEEYKTPEKYFSEYMGVVKNGRHRQ